MRNRAQANGAEVQELLDALPVDQAAGRPAETAGKNPGGGTAGTKPAPFEPL